MCGNMASFCKPFLPVRSASAGLSGRGRESRGGRADPRPRGGLAATIEKQL